MDQRLPPEVPSPSRSSRTKVTRAFIERYPTGTVVSVEKIDELGVEHGWYPKGFIDRLLLHDLRHRFLTAIRDCASTKKWREDTTTPDQFHIVVRDRGSTYEVISAARAYGDVAGSSPALTKTFFKGLDQKCRRHLAGFNFGQLDENERHIAEMRREIAEALIISGLTIANQLAEKLKRKTDGDDKPTKAPPPPKPKKPLT